MSRQGCQFCQFPLCEGRLEGWPISLEAVQKGASRDCKWCKVLMDGARLYRDRWPHLAGEADHVQFTIHRALFRTASTPPKIFLQWPAMTIDRQSETAADVKYRELTGEESLEEIELKFTVEEPISEVSFLHIQKVFSSCTQAPEWLRWYDSGRTPCIVGNSSSPECFELIKSWISVCESSHSDCRSSISLPSSRPKRLLQILPTVEVLKVRLVNASTVLTDNYTALSHCWGHSGHFKTTTNNLKTHENEGITVLRLPKTFQDAIDITWKLGIYYIWIDSLCIIQGQKAEWEAECPKMGEIYGNAYLVIAASHAHDGSGGCYSYRESPKVQLQASKQNIITVAITEKIDHNIWQKDEPSWQPWEDTNLPLFRRAWAFQERLLAKRLVHYTNRELVWECRSSAWCECGQLDRTISEKGRFPTSISFKARYAQVVEYGSDRDRMELWLSVIDQYQSRQISKQSDRLPALSAIAQQVNRSEIMGNYIAGMWVDWLMASLLWWSDHRRSGI